MKILSIRKISHLNLFIFMDLTFSDVQINLSQFFKHSFNFLSISMLILSNLTVNFRNDVELSIVCLHLSNKFSYSFGLQLAAIRKQKLYQILNRSSQHKFKKIIVVGLSRLFTFILQIVLFI